MLRQLLMAAAISACTIMIHALVMTAVVRTSQATAIKVAARPNLLLIAVMVVTVSVLMAAHTCEVIVWSLAYGLLDAVPAGTNLLYFAFVNYTTLGYGDVVPVERWQLLGPITAMNGILLFGWSTAVIFECCAKRWLSRLQLTTVFRALAILLRWALIDVLLACHRRSRGSWGKQIERKSEDQINHQRQHASKPS